MYQCISLNHHTYINAAEQQLHQFFTTLRDGTKPQEFYTKFVTRIFVDDLRNETFSRDFLPLCSNLSSLACWVDRNPLNLPKIESIISPHARPSSTLRRFSVYWGSLPSRYQSFHHLLYRNLTHLDLDFQPKVPWEELTTLENLSHFHLDCIASFMEQKPQEAASQLDSIIHSLLPYFPPRLRCFVLLAPALIITGLVIGSLRDTDIRYQSFSKLISGDYDDRIVLGSSGGMRPLSPSFFDPETHEDPFRYIVPIPYELGAWTYLPPGQTDFWMEADKIISNRRQNLSRSGERRQPS
jgi:hypothetical protein